MPRAGKTICLPGSKLTNAAGILHVGQGRGLVPVGLQLHQRILAKQQLQAHLTCRPIQSVYLRTRRPVQSV